MKCGKGKKGKMTVLLVFEANVLCLIDGYFAQGRRCFE